MSCNAAPVDEVIMPTRLIISGKDFFIASENKPCAANWHFNSSNCCFNNPSPSGAMVSAIN